MESQKLVKLVLLSLLVVGCNNTNSSSSLNSSTTSESVSVSSTLSSTSSTSSESSSKNNIDYSLFDNNIIGTWYVHSAAQGVLNLNDVDEPPPVRESPFLGKVHPFMLGTDIVLPEMEMFDPAVKAFCLPFHVLFSVSVTTL